MENLPDVASPKRRAKFVIGGAVIALAVVGLTVWAMARPGSQAFYMTTSEVLASGAGGAAAGDVRVNGKVVPGTIERDGLQTTFDISDGHAAVTVVTDVALPDTFREESDVVAQGTFDGNVFAASHVSAKCPSKFKAKA